MLTAAIFLPIVGAAVLACIPREREEVLKAVALLITLATAVVGLALLFGFNYDDAGSLQYEVDTGWIEVINSRYHICLLYTSPSPRDRTRSRMPSSA